jgi:hypothetical protein
VDRFIVGTGRCGSTLLSRMLAESPQTLSLFEFFNGLDMTLRFGSEPVDGKRFAELISQEHPFVTMVLSRGYSVPEIAYPFGPGARYQLDDGLPWLLVSALPRLTDDPDALFGETLAFASSLPSQPLARHYRQLFDWWAQRLGRELWIERSGSSIDYVASLDGLFPEARFVHLHRDGREAALSMREHHAFRLAICLTSIRPAQGTRAHQELATLGPTIPDAGPDPIREMLESRPDAGHFGRFWSGQIERGTPALEKLGAERVLAIGFEELIEQPGSTLRRLCRFFDIDPERGGWIERAAALIRGVPPTRFEQLPSDERERLAEACAPGMQRLGRSS